MQQEQLYQVLMQAVSNSEIMLPPPPPNFLIVLVPLKPPKLMRKPKRLIYKRKGTKVRFMVGGRVCLCTMRQ